MSEEMTQEEVKETAKPEIDVSAYESVKNDMHKYKRQLVEEQKEKAEALNKLKEMEEKALQNSQNYKELWEKQKNESEGWKGKFEGLSKQIVENEKRKAIYSEAVKAGINKELLDVLDAFDMSDVLVETTDSGKFIVNGADTWINALKAEKPSMFQVKSDPKLNNKSGSYDGREKTYSMSELLELQKSDYAKYKDIITTKRHLITK